MECANAVDLYSLNEHLSRGVGSEADPNFNDVKYQKQNYPDYRKDYRESANSIDLSLAGTGEGASGYSGKNETLHTNLSGPSNYQENDLDDYLSPPFRDWDPRETFNSGSSETSYLEEHRILDNVPRGFSKNDDDGRYFEEVRFCDHL